MCSCSGASVPACLQVARVCSACCTQPRTRTCEGSAFSTTSYKLLRLLLLTSPYRGVCCGEQGPVHRPSPVRPHLHVCYRPTASRFSRAMRGVTNNLNSGQCICAYKSQFGYLMAQHQQLIAHNIIQKCCTPAVSCIICINK